MKKNNNLLLKTLDNRKGVSAIMVAILLPVLLGFAALAIDVGYMFTTKNELQNVADAAALAGARELGQIYLNNGSYDSSTDSELIASYNLQIKNEAKFLSVQEDDRNKAAGKSITPIDDDIEIGVWKNDSFKPFDKTDDETYPPFAVKVSVRNQSPVSSFFARIFGDGFDSFQITALATASLSGPPSMPPGELKAPFGISNSWFINQPLNKVSFDSQTCAGWHNFVDKPQDKPKPSTMAEKMLNFIKAHPEGTDWLDTHFGDYQKIDEVVAEFSPETKVGDTVYYFTEGVDSLITNPNSTDVLQWSDNKETLTGHSALGKEPAPLAASFDFFRFRDDDGDNKKWTTVVPIYEDENCSPVNGETLIVGFAKISITAINTQPEKSIDVELDYNYQIGEGRGSGNHTGNILGPIPHLVQ